RGHRPGIRRRRGRVLPLRTCLQVDALMMSKSYSAKSQPTGCVAAAALAQTVPLRLLVTADTFRGASHTTVGGVSLFSVRAGGGTHTGRRVPVPGLRSRSTARAGRLFNGNAHADRCAPPGRNPGGGAQGQPD